MLFSLVRNGGNTNRTLILSVVLTALVLATGASVQKDSISGYPRMQRKTLRPRKLRSLSIHSSIQILKTFTISSIKSEELI